MSTMENREAFLMHVKLDAIEEFKKRYEDFWPELKNQLSQTGVYDYTLNLDEKSGTVILSQKSVSYCSTTHMRGGDLFTQWLTSLAPLLVCNHEGKPIVTPMSEIFHID